MVITVTTTASSVEPAPVAQVERAQGDEVIAVDQLAALVDGQHPIGVAVEGQPDRRARRHDRAPAGRPGWVEPQPVVDVAAVGLGVQHLDRRRRAGAGRRARWPSATPLAQSMTTCSPSRRRPSTERRSDSAPPLDVGVAPRPPPASPPAPAGAGVASAGPVAGQEPVELGLEVGLDGVGELDPAGGEELDAVVAEGVVRGRDHRARARRGRRTPRRRSGVGTTPSDLDGRARRRPGRAARAASMRGPDARGSRPITKPDRRPGAEHRRRGAARAPTTRSSVSSSAGPRTPSVPKRRDIGRPRLSAWSTEAPCGPS